MTSAPPLNGSRADSTNRARRCASADESSVRLLNWRERKAERGQFARQYIVAGFVRAGTLFSTNGRPGLGKTALLVDLARAISGGSEWMGCETMRCSVVYIAAEDEDDVSARLEATGANEVKLLVCDEPFLLTKPQKAVKLVQQAIDIARTTSEAPVVVMIDTLRAALGGHSVMEDKNTAPGLNALRKLAEDEHVAIGIANHTNRSDPKETKGETLESLVALEFVLTGSGEVTELHVGKNRSGPGRRQLAVVRLTSCDVDGVAAAVVQSITPVTPNTGASKSSKGRPSGASKVFVEALREALIDRGERRPIYGEHDAPPVQMVRLDDVRPIFARNYPVTEGSEDKRADTVRKALDRAVKSCVERGHAHTGNWNDDSWWWLRSENTENAGDSGAARWR